MPTAVVRDGNIRMECSFLLDEEVSKEYIVENCIKMVLGTIWRGFCDLEKEEGYINEISFIDIYSQKPKPRRGFGSDCYIKSL